MQVEIGADRAHEGYRDKDSDDPDLVRFRDLDGERVVSLTIPDGTPLTEAFMTVCGALEHHVAKDGNPVWVQTESEGLTALLVEHFGIESNVRPDDWGKSTGYMSPGAITTMLTVLWALVLVKLFSLELRTNAGRDFQARVMGDTASTGTGNYHSASYIGVTANADAPAGGDTVLAGEVIVGTLSRAEATYGHTNGTATYTLTKTFTSDQPITLAKLGVFNGAGPGGAASASNTLVFETLLNATAVMISGDQTQVTDTVTM